MSCMEMSVSRKTALFNRTVTLTGQGRGAFGRARGGPGHGAGEGGETAGEGGLDGGLVC
jgi:hypothetical protein